MKNLIKVTQSFINGAETNSVNSRDIYKELGIKQGYSDWIKYQISKLNLIEDIDFTKHIYVVGKNKVTDYIVTTDVAKNIGLISFTKKGQEIRDYFIDVEKKINKSIMSPKQIIESLQLSAQALKHHDEQLDEHHHRLKMLEQNRRLDAWQEKALIDAHHKKVYELADQYKEDSRDKKLVSSLHRKVWQLFKKHFSLPRYNELSVGKFENGLRYIRNLTLSDMV